MMALVGISAMSGQSQEICTESVARREEKINAEDAEVTESKARCFKSQNNRENVSAGWRSASCRLIVNVQEHVRFAVFPLVLFASSALIFSISLRSRMPVPVLVPRYRRHAWPRAASSP